MVEIFLYSLGPILQLYCHFKTYIIAIKYKLFISCKQMNLLFYFKITFHLIFKLIIRNHTGFSFTFPSDESLLDWIVSLASTDILARTKIIIGNMDWVNTFSKTYYNLDHTSAFTLLLTSVFWSQGKHLIKEFEHEPENKVKYKFSWYSQIPLCESEEENHLGFHLRSRSKQKIGIHWDNRIREGE